MSESYIPDRIIFKNKSEQGQFILKIKDKLGLKWIDLAKKLKLNTRTIRDWSRNKKRMPFYVAMSLSKKTGILIPADAKKLSWKDHTIKAGKIGGKKHVLIYGGVGGDEKYRKQKWQDWWLSKGRFIENSITQPKSIKLPEKSLSLAEFVGIMMGDGGISDYAVSIYLNPVADREYVVYVCRQLARLFGVEPKKYQTKKPLCIRLVLARVNIVDYCVKIGLKKGNKLKQNLDFPKWIRNDRNFEIECIRGLIDTDGCFFKHKYTVNRKQYLYNKIAFTSRSPALVHSVREILINLGINVRISKDGNDVRIDDQKSVERYVDIIGTNNPKHKNKFL